MERRRDGFRLMASSVKVLLPFRALWQMAIRFAHVFLRPFFHSVRRAFPSRTGSQPAWSSGAFHSRPQLRLTQGLRSFRFLARRRLERRLCPQVLACTRKEQVREGIPLRFRVLTLISQVENPRCRREKRSRLCHALTSIAPAEQASGGQLSRRDR